MSNNYEELKLSFASLTRSSLEYSGGVLVCPMNNISASSRDCDYKELFTKNVYVNKYITAQVRDLEDYTSS